MSSKAQIEANRQNAQKSTGPKTEEGKAAVSQNAIKHGLTARQDVIATESQELYDLRRDQMLEELNPTGLIEKMLAERIVSLSWRLDRAATMQTDALNSMMVDQCYFPSSAAEHATSPRSYPTRSEYFTPNTDLLLGCAVRNDIRDNKVLDRLLMYERRIERSLYKTMAELKNLQQERKRNQQEITKQSHTNHNQNPKNKPNFTLDSDPGPQQTGKEPTLAPITKISNTQKAAQNLAKQSQSCEYEDASKTVCRGSYDLCPRAGGVENKANQTQPTTSKLDNTQPMEKNADSPRPSSALTATVS